jgi:hypothetical protein
MIVSNDYNTQFDAHQRIQDALTAASCSTRYLIHTSLPIIREAASGRRRSESLSCTSVRGERSSGTAELWNVASHMHLEAPRLLYVHIVQASRLMPLPKRPYSSALSSPISSRSSLSFSSRLATSSLILSTDADRRSCTSESGNE